MTNNADVVVVGGGVVGASIAFHLARRGAGEIILCEPTRGSSLAATTQSGGLLRVHHTMACDIELAVRSLPTFQHFGEIVGGSCEHHVPGFALLVGAAEADALVRNTETVRACGGRTEVLEPDRLSSLYPGLKLDGVALAAYEPNGGYVDPAAVTRELLRAARAGGVRVLEGARVESLLLRDDRISGVRTSLGRFDSPRVVLAAGAASSGLASGIGVDLPLVPKPIAIGFVRSGAGPFEVPVCIDDTLGNYFRPDREAGLLFGVDCDPERRTGAEPVGPELAEIEAARAELEARVPVLSTGEPAGSRLGVDAYTPDRRPLIGATGPAGLYVATGMSGGGVKSAPAVGELAAQEIHTGREHESLAPYRPQRFALGRQLAPEHAYRWM